MTKVKIFGLIQQACFGDFKQDGPPPSPSPVALGTGSKREIVLDIMKQVAWAKEKGRTQLACMK